MMLPDADHDAPTPAMDRSAGDAAALTDQGTEHPADRRLDLRGLHCPMPVLRARKALRQVAVGAGIVLECTDPLTAIDIPHWVAEDGHDLAQASRNGDLFVYCIVRRR